MWITQNIWRSHSVLVAPGNIFSPPFSLQVTNPVLSISILRQPQGSVDTAVKLTVQPRLSITSSGRSIVGQQVQATADASCYSGASLLFDTCTILPDSTCEFRDLAVIGITVEVSRVTCSPWHFTNYLIRFLLQKLTSCLTDLFFRELKKFAFVSPFLEYHPRYRNPSMWGLPASLYLLSSLICHSAGHQSKYPEVVSIEWIPDDNVVCCLGIFTYRRDEQLWVRCFCMARRSGVFLVFLLCRNVRMVVCNCYCPYFHIFVIVRDLSAITLRFQTLPLNTLSYLWSTFQHFSCLHWFLFSRFYVPRVVALSPFKAENRQPWNCTLGYFQVTGMKCDADG